MRRRLSSKTGFTLIELLIVVAILAVLASIALPNFLEAQTRSRVARAKADMRTIATALETYAADNKSYPPVPIGLPPRFRFFRPLTTPVSYLTDIPRDPFDSIDRRGFGGFRQGLYGYGSMPVETPSRWILSSDGPDRNGDANPLAFYPGYSPELFTGQLAGFDYMVYDPTNGTLSRGDIFRASDYLPQA